MYFGCATIYLSFLFLTNKQPVRKRTESGQLVSVRRSASGHLYADKVNHHHHNHNNPFLGYNVHKIMFFCRLCVTLKKLSWYLKTYVFGQPIYFAWLFHENPDVNINRRFYKWRRSPIKISFLLRTKKIQRNTIKCDLGNLVDLLVKATLTHAILPQAEITKCDMVSTNGVAHQVCAHIK